MTQSANILLVNTLRQTGGTEVSLLSVYTGWRSPTLDIYSNPTRTECYDKLPK